MEEKDFMRIFKDVIYDELRMNNNILYFIEFPDGKWLMEDKASKTNHPQFAMPFKDKKIAEMFVKHYKLDSKIGCSVTEHEFVSSPNL